MIRLRRSRRDDGARVIAIWRKAVEATHDFLTSQDRDAIAAEVRAFLPAAPLELAVDGGDRAIGFILRDGARLEGLFVDPAWHGKGVGRALVEHARTLAAPILVDVNEANRAALAFYEHLGFVRCGRSALDGQGRPYPLIHLRDAPSA